jgi:hypothetical protein
MSTTIIQSFGGNVGIGTDSVGDSILNVNKTLSNVGALTVTSLTVAGVSNPDVPAGLIIMWYDKNNIPTGWLLCNGSNGTPDLNGFFPRGTSSTQAVGATQSTENVTFGAIGTDFPNHNHNVNAKATENHGHNTTSQGDHNHTTSSNTPHQHNMNNVNHEHGANAANHVHNLDAKGHNHDQTINDTRFAAYSGGYAVESIWASWAAHGGVAANGGDNRITNSNNNHNHNTNSNHPHQHNFSVSNNTHKHNLGGSGGHQHSCQSSLNINSQSNAGAQHQHVCVSLGAHQHTVGLQSNTPAGASFPTVPKHRRICFIMKGPAS